jgi:galactose oxidase-like protein/PKD domain-containing protein
MPRTFQLALVVVTAATAALFPNGVRAQSCPVNVPHVTGTWVVLPYQMPINPISASLLPDGKVLIVAGSENDAKNNSVGAESYRGAIWDPTGTTESSVTVKNLTYDVFCSGTASLPDGRQLIVGGTSDYSFTGEHRASIFNPDTDAFVQSQNMANGRWYATATTLGDGRIMAMSGLTSTGGTNTTIEIYDLRNAGRGWNAPTNVPFTPPLFPRLALLPNGTVFYTGQGSGASNANSWIFNPASGAWTMSAATTMNRTYGSAVILPLLPPNYTPRVMNFGGGSPATSSTEIIDLSSSNPSWSPGPNMSTGRIQMNAVILPNGSVLAEGGSVNNESPDTPGKSADLYDPASNTMRSGGAAAYSRLYHSTALLLPDATVVSMGSNPGARGSYEAAIEIYTPPYLFDANDHLVTSARPSITTISPASGMVGYNSLLAVNYTSTSAISSAVLVRSGSVTHAFDMEQRLIGLCGPAPEQPNCSGANGVINLTTPPNSNVAPPGYYMLFLLDSAGVPSKAAFIQLTPYTTSAPSGTISSPSSDVTIPAGGAVAFGTSSSAAQYSWVFPGGSPATSTAQNPGNVTFAAPGTYQASLTLIDSSGNSDPSPPTRQITVTPASPDFSIAVGPSAQQVFPGGAAAFTVTVTPISGFTGAVSLSVGSESGFPSGITSAGFSPASISGSGSSTLTMDTTSSTVPWALSLTITGSSGTITHTASTTLLVNLAAPASLTATPGDSQISLAWPASVGATRYEVQRSNVSQGPYVGIACPTGMSYLDTGLTNGTAYYYVVSAAFTGSPDAGGASANSSEATATPQGAAPTPPAPPTNLTTKATKPGPVNLQWTQSSTTGVTQNSIYRRTSGTTYPSTPLATISATTSYHDSSVVHKTTYCYVVTAIDAAGQSVYSNESCVATH